jgi:hypothetical protein
MKSVAVGVIGGFGNIVNGKLLDVGAAGTGGGDVHTHMRFRRAVVKRGRRGKKVFQKGAPIDPRKVFCADLGFK